jgi:hypothetical protein
MPKSYRANTKKRTAQYAGGYVFPRALTLQFMIRFAGNAIHTLRGAGALRRNPATVAVTKSIVR